MSPLRFSFVSALRVAVLLFLVAGTLSAQPFTDRIKISSHFATLQAAIDDAGEQGMVIVDRDYLDLDELVLPRRFRMVGMGPQGKAVIAFSELATSGIRIQAPTGDESAWVVIENLDIEGPYVPDPEAGIDPTIKKVRGIDLTKANAVFLRNLTVRGFDYGIYGREAYSVHIENCNVSVNRVDNIHLGKICTSWRIRGGICSFSGRYGINILLGNDNLIDGVRLESNPVAGIRTNTEDTHIMNNRFECNYVPPFCPANARAVIVDTDAVRTTLIDNYYSGLYTEDFSDAQNTVRFDAGYTTRIAVDGDDVFHASTGTPAEVQFRIDADGFVAVGPDFVPDTRLHVRDSLSGATAVPENHVALIENSAPGKIDDFAQSTPNGGATAPPEARQLSNNADVLALAVEVRNPSPENNFITFFGAGSPLGAVEGNGVGGVTYKSGSADFAEWLERADKHETLEPGDVVGVFGGTIAKRTHGAEQLHVVSTAPLLLGNEPAPQTRDDYTPVAFVGQVPVKVRGPVRAGDYLVASGRNDGVAVAVNARELRREPRPVIGRAWQTSTNEDVKQVNAFVCPSTPQPPSSPSAEKRAEAVVTALEERIATLEARLQKLESSAP